MPLTRGKAVGYDADLRIYIALAIGQVLISQVDIMGSTAFNIVVAFFAIALS